MGQVNFKPTVKHLKKASKELKKAWHELYKLGHDDYQKTSEQIGQLSFDINCLIGNMEVGKLKEK